MVCSRRAFPRKKEHDGPPRRTRTRTRKTTTDCYTVVLTAEDEVCSLLSVPDQDTFDPPALLARGALLGGTDKSPFVLHTRPHMGDGRDIKEVKGT